MIPGRTTKLTESFLASADVINPKTDLVVLGGTATITNIIPNFGGGFSGILYLGSTSGVTIGTGGNITTTGTTIPAGGFKTFIWSKALQTWLLHIDAT